jgi:2-keto-4-pentenoate hydratase
MRLQSHRIDSERVSAMAAVLVHARHGRPPSPEMTMASEPGSLSEALVVQQHVMQSLGESVMGWKAAMLRDAMVFAPIYASAAYASPARIACSFDLPLVAEVEIAFRLCEDLGDPQDESLIRRAFGEVLIGIELVQSRLPAPSSGNRSWFLADNLGNAGYVVGTPVASTGDIATDDFPFHVTIDGMTVYHANGERSLSDSFSVVFHLARAIDGHLGGLRRGQFVTTGHLCGAPFRVTKPTVIRASTPFGSVEAAISHSD